MSLDPLLVEILVDPVDHGPLQYVEAESILYNPRRRVVYEVHGTIPVMLESESRPVDEDEHARLMAAAGRETGPRS